MSIIGPDVIALQVRDLEVSASFYEEVLGLRRAAASPPGAVVFATAPIPFAVREPLSGVDLEGTDRPGLGIALWLRADDVAAVREALDAAGRPILRDLAPSPFGLTLTFADPEGYAITLHDQG